MLNNRKPNKNLTPIFFKKKRKISKIFPGINEFKISVLLLQEGDVTRAGLLVLIFWRILMSTWSVSFLRDRFRGQATRKQGSNI